MSGKNVVIIDQNVFKCLFFCFCSQCVSPINSFKEFDSGFGVILRLEFFFLLEFDEFSEDPCLYWGVILGFSKIFRCWEPESVFFCSGLFGLRSSIR